MTASRLIFTIPTTNPMVGPSREGSETHMHHASLRRKKHAGWAIARIQDGPCHQRWGHPKKRSNVPNEIENIISLQTEYVSTWNPIFFHRANMRNLTIHIRPSPRPHRFVVLEILGYNFYMIFLAHHLPPATQTSRSTSELSSSSGHRISLRCYGGFLS